MQATAGTCIPPSSKPDKGVLDPGADIFGLRCADGLWGGQQAGHHTLPTPRLGAVNNLPKHTQHLCVLKKKIKMLLEWEAQGQAGTEGSQVRNIRWDHLLEQGQQTGFSRGLSAVHQDHLPGVERFTQKVL